MLTIKLTKIAISLPLSQMSRYGSVTFSSKSQSDVIWFKTETYIFDIRRKSNKITVDQPKADVKDLDFFFLSFYLRARLSLCLFCVLCWAKFDLILAGTSLTALERQVWKYPGIISGKTQLPFFSQKVQYRLPSPDAFR